MGEILNGERPEDFMLRPPPGYCTLSSVRNNIFTSAGKLVMWKRMKAMCADLGIELGPLVRNDWYKQKVYKNRLRWLTEDEAARIIALFHERNGSKL